MAQPVWHWATTIILPFELSLRIIVLLKFRNVAGRQIYLWINRILLHLISASLILFGIEAFTFPTVHEPRIPPLSRIRDWADRYCPVYCVYEFLIYFQVRFYWCLWSRDAFCPGHSILSWYLLCSCLRCALRQQVSPPPFFVSVTLTQERSGALRVLF